MARAIATGIEHGFSGRESAKSQSLQLTHRVITKSAAFGTTADSLN
jgi:hypothetical protein